MVEKNRNIPKTVVIGASGFLGRSFLAAYRQVYPDCIGTVRGLVNENKNIFSFDLLKPNISSLGLSKKKYKQALICAGEAKVYTCEENKASTRKVNVDGVFELIRQLANEGVKPIFFSSDHVFDGRSGFYSEDSLVNPITEYGRQKAEIEANIGSLTKNNFLVIRLSKVFSLKKEDGSFLDEIARTLLSNATINVAFDQIFCPILVDDLVGAVKWLQATEKTGMVNVCPPEAWSRYDLAIILAKQLGVNPSKVKKVSLDEIMRYPKMPKNTSMISKILPKTCVTFTLIASCIKRIAQGWLAPKNTLVR